MNCISRRLRVLKWRSAFLAIAGFCFLEGTAHALRYAAPDWELQFEAADVVARVRVGPIAPVSSPFGSPQTRVVRVIVPVKGCRPRELLKVKEYNDGAFAGGGIHPLPSGSDLLLFASRRDGGILTVDGPYGASPARGERGDLTVFRAMIKRAAAVENAKRAALQKYPALAIASSPFNRLFIEQRALLLLGRDALLEADDWPLRLAERSARVLESATPEAAAPPQ